MFWNKLKVRKTRIALAIRHWLVSIYHAEWLSRNELDKVSLIITNAHTKEVLECWDFNVQSETKSEGENIDPNNPKSSKDLKRIQQEIGSVMRQISGTVTYLPLLDCICSFDVLIHTVKDCALPEKWNETEAVHIQNSQTVKLRSFSTGLHHVDTVVNYKLSTWMPSIDFHQFSIFFFHTFLICKCMNRIINKYQRNYCN